MAKGEKKKRAFDGIGGKIKNLIFGVSDEGEGGLKHTTSAIKERRRKQKEALEGSN